MVRARYAQLSPKRVVAQQFEFFWLLFLSSVVRTLHSEEAAIRQTYPSLIDYCETTGYDDPLSLDCAG
ncbi:hypothetical protein N7530_008989 [Penicillium desertorum]|uniref:Uncharacterized protein n=1 Tax=Penicillium desertorum TaxID=1303715 RepID=A0A9W9WQX3_9EURO|nr:hypothetical protein N7530_008989 [Penicillium desertorum]